MNKILATIRKRALITPSNEDKEILLAAANEIERSQRAKDDCLNELFRKLRSQNFVEPGDMMKAIASHIDRMKSGSTDGIILKYLDCSTSHVTEKDMELLKETPEFLYDFTHAPYEYGAFVSVSGADELEDETQELLEYGFSESFINLRKYAELQGCSVLRLDAHGEVIEGMPTFEW